MPKDCQSFSLSKGYPKTVKGVWISLDSPTSISSAILSVKVLPSHLTEGLRVGLGLKQTFYGEGVRDDFWTIEYIEYLSPKAVKLEICHCTFEEEEPEEPDIIEVEIDYDKINEGIEILLITQLSDVNTGISDLEDSISTMDSDITSTSVYLRDRLIKLKTSVTTTSDNISSKIDSLKFPSLTDIKQLLFAMCSDLADSLWNKILDRIEERYNK